MKRRNFLPPWPAAVTALLALLALAAPVLADIGPDVTVRLASPFVAVKSGDTYAGRLEITVGEPGTLSDFALAGAGWTPVMTSIPAADKAKAGDKLVVEFTALALDPQQRLEFSCKLDGRDVSFPIDLSTRNVINMTEGGTVRQVPEGSVPPGNPDPKWQADGLAVPTTAPATSKRLVTVHGRFGAPREDGLWQPAHSATVQVWDEDGLIDNLMGTTTTNFDGYFSIAVETFMADLFDDPDIFVRIELTNGRVDTYEPTSGSNYAWVTGVNNNYAGTDLNLGTFEPAADELHPSIFHFTNACRAWVHDSNLGYDVSKCRVEWPSSAWPNCSPSGRIQIRSDFNWNDGCLWHEYGHWFDHEIASWDPFDYCNGICDGTQCGHCFWCSESQSIAWLEGWAQFHSWAVGAWVPGYYGVTPLAAVDGESLADCWPGTYGDPLLTEGFIAALLQDISDSAQDSHGVYGSFTDELSLGVAAAFSVNALDNPTGSQNFLDKFAARYPGYKSAFWATAANCGYTLDTVAPGVVTGLTSPSHAISVASPDNTPTFTWTAATDNYSGVAGYGLYISTGGAGLPTAVMDIGAVTSWTSTALAPGTYWFNIRTVDRAGHWSAGYAAYGPFIIRSPEPADLVPYLAAGWDATLVPRATNDATGSSCTISPTLTGGGSTYWNIFGKNAGEVATSTGFYGQVHVDGTTASSAYWGVIGAGGLYYAANWGPVTVQPGRHTFTFVHDATHLIAETDETNNNAGTQYIWSPLSVAANATVARTAPLSTGGWSEASGTLWYNSDGLRMPTSGGWWHAMALWADDNTKNVDGRLHVASTGSQDGFGANIGWSAQTTGRLDVLLANRNVDSSANFDIGVLGSASETVPYHAFHAQSSGMAFGDSVTVSMGSGVPLLLREFSMPSASFGPVSVTVACDPAASPLKVVLLNSTYTTGTLTSGVVAGSILGSAQTDANGRARVAVNLSATGWYGIAVYREPTSSTAAMNVTIEISTTPPDLAPYAPAGWYAALTPRPVADSNATTCAVPDTLGSTPNVTYFNVGAQNYGPVSSNVPAYIQRDGSDVTWIQWSSAASGWVGTYNWSWGYALSGGRHTLALRVDSLNKLEETNETNNVRGEQWIWKPARLAPGATAVRATPPSRMGGWSDVTNGETRWYNCDGLRLVGTGAGWWKAVAVLPPTGADYDIRMHAASTGAKNGFGASVTGSYLAGTACEYVLVDYNNTAYADYDVGVLGASGSGSYKVHAAASTYLGAPYGYMGPYSVPSGGLVTLYEVYLAAGTHAISLINQSSADLDLAVHRAGTVYQGPTNAVALGASGGAGQGEQVVVTVATPAYYCLVIHRQDQGTGAAAFKLGFANGVTAVDPTGLPSRTKLAGAYPNPFNPQTTIAFDLAHTGQVRIVIHDVQGRAIATLADGVMTAGRHSVVWMGKDDHGRVLASGVYYARLTAPDGNDTVKLMLVK